MAQDGEHRADTANQHVEGRTGADHDATDEIVRECAAGVLGGDQNLRGGAVTCRKIGNDADRVLLLFDHRKGLIDRLDHILQRPRTNEVLVQHALLVRFPS
mgnify:CR=1 FL=1